MYKLRDVDWADAARVDGRPPPEEERRENSSSNAGMLTAVDNRSPSGRSIVCSTRNMSSRRLYRTGPSATDYPEHQISPHTCQGTSRQPCCGWSLRLTGRPGPTTRSSSPHNMTLPLCTLFAKISRKLYRLGTRRSHAYHNRSARHINPIQNTKKTTMVGRSGRHRKKSSEALLR